MSTSLGGGGGAMVDGPRAHSSEMSIEDAVDRTDEILNGHGLGYLVRRVAIPKSEGDFPGFKMVTRRT